MRDLAALLRRRWGAGGEDLLDDGLLRTAKKVVLASARSALRTSVVSTADGGASAENVPTLLPARLCRQELTKRILPGQDDVLFHLLSPEAVLLEEVDFLITRLYGRLVDDKAREFRGDPRCRSREDEITAVMVDTSKRLTDALGSQGNELRAMLEGMRGGKLGGPRISEAKSRDEDGRRWGIF